MNFQREMGNLTKIIDILKKKKTKKLLEIADSQKCPLCQFILDDPCQTKCGCIFCKRCIQAWFKDNPRCPGDDDDCRQQEVGYGGNIVEDRAKAREIFKLSVTCIFDGCDTVVELGRMDDHMISCESRSTKCDLCGEEVHVRTLSSHKEEECVWRKGECPYNCGVVGPVVIGDHIKACANRPLRSVLAGYGYRVDHLTDQQFEEHLRNDSVSFSLMLVASLKEKDEKIKKLENVLTKFDLEIEKLKREIDSIEKAMEISRDRIFKCEPTSSMLNDDDSRSRNGVLLWRIEKFSKLRANQELGKESCITSEPFYTSDFGYKMCLKLYPNGDGPGRGTHLSVFVVIMKGDYDDILSWPFCHKIRLSVLSSTDTSLEHSELLKPDPNSPCYMKPNMTFNVGAGSPKFFDRSRLEMKFLNDDQFLIKAAVMVE